MTRNLNFATLNRRGLPLCFQPHLCPYQSNLDGSDLAEVMLAER